MNLRNKIAKWLAPELARYVERLEDIALQDAFALNRSMHSDAKFVLALRDIARLRTPKCAHIGNRMADIAEAALAHREGDSA